MQWLTPLALLPRSPPSSLPSVFARPPPHPGIGQGRVTDNLAQDINLLDGAFTVPDGDTIRMVYHLLDRDGLYVGASTALNVVAAKQLAVKLGKGSRVVTILCDGAYRCVGPSPLLSLLPLAPVPLHLSLHLLLALAQQLADPLPLPPARSYQSRLFSKKWLESKGLYDEIPAALQKYVVLP